VFAVTVQVAAHPERVYEKSDDQVTIIGPGPVTDMVGAGHKKPDRSGLSCVLTEHELSAHWYTRTMS
jgi:hypothetical protein